MAAGIVVRMRGSITVQAKPGGSNRKKRASNARPYRVNGKADF